MLNDRNRQFEKADLIRQIESVSEETVWIELFGMDAMPTMAREHDLIIRSCRNDAMHMHTINRESFLKARRLVIRATTEIEAYTEALTGDQKALGDYSEKMLSSLETFTSISEQLNETIRMMTDSLANVYAPVLAMEATNNAVSKLAAVLNPSLNSVSTIVDGLRAADTCGSVEKVGVGASRWARPLP